MQSNSVYVAGATERELYLPAGTWIDWWRSVTYVETDGSFDLGAAKIQTGGKPLTVPAPIAEIPLMVQAGAVLVMLAPDVFTLAEHGDDPSIIHLDDRDDELHVIAFPRGESSGNFFDAGSYTSTETAGAWTLDLDEADGRTVRLQASLQTWQRHSSPARSAWMAKRSRNPTGRTTTTRACSKSNIGTAAASCASRPARQRARRVLVEAT